MWVVVAWTDTVRVPSESYDLVRIDLGQQPNMTDLVRPRAAVWLRNGTDEDRERAARHISREEPETGRAFTYPADEPDPLGRAKRDIVAA